MRLLLTLYRLSSVKHKHMKKVAVLILSFLITLPAVLAQNGKLKFQRGLSPARGHYKQLAPFSPKAKSGGEVQFVNKLFQNEKFLKDFENVKQEWLTNCTSPPDFAFGLKGASCL